MSFVWTQSALKDLERETTCPYRWYGQWVLKTPEARPESTEAQMLGNYFEYLCIGANAKGEAIKEIPKTKSGEPTAVQKRLEQQALKFKEFFDPKSENYLGYEILQVQYPLSGELSGIKIEGTADIHAATTTRPRTPVIIDIKLTADAYSTYSEYGWGNSIEDMDLVQQVAYCKLYEQESGVKPLMVLMVFEHGTAMRSRIITIDIDDWRFDAVENRFLVANSVYEKYKEKGWSRIPSEKECGSCKLDCTKRFKKAVTSFEKVKY